MRASELPSAERLHELFRYDDGWLYRKVGVSGGARAGSRAGSLSSRGYFRLRVDGENFLAHRLIFTMHHGVIPAEMNIDHIDDNPGNNKIENLRLATRAENTWNRRGVPAGSRSGVLGVSPYKNGWHVRVRANGRQVGRWFKSRIVATIYADLIRHKYHSPFYGSDRTPGLAELLA